MRNLPARALSVVPSVLDRLLDDDPAAVRDAARSRRYDVRDLKRSLARDLEALLNTRCAAAPPPAFPLAHRSLAGFGVPDLTGRGIAGTDDRDAVRAALAEAIDSHESRLAHVQVALEAPAPGERHLRFRVDALLVVEPAREPVRFDALLQVTTGRYQVRDGDDPRGIARR